MIYYQPVDISLKSHIIFDFDETIATLDIDWTDWYTGIFEIIKTHDPSFLIPHDPENIHVIQNVMFEKYGQHLKGEIDEFICIFETNQNKDYNPIAKTIDFISSLYEQNKTLYLWTNNHTNTVIPILKSLNLFQMFKTVVGREMVDFIKPNPYGFAHIINKDDLPKHLFVMIGNNSSDQDAATASGIEYMDVTKIPA